MAVKTEALSIFARLLSAAGGFLPLDKYLSWTSRKFRKFPSGSSLYSGSEMITPFVPSAVSSPLRSSSRYSR